MSRRGFQTKPYNSGRPNLSLFVFGYEVSGLAGRVNRLLCEMVRRARTSPGPFPLSVLMLAGYRLTAGGVQETYVWWGTGSFFTRVRDNFLLRRLWRWPSVSVWLSP